MEDVDKLDMEYPGGGVYGFRAICCFYCKNK